MAWSGIFYNGVWVCGFDFLPNGFPAAGGVLDVTGGAASVNATFARFSGKGVNFNGGNPNNGSIGRSFSVNLNQVITGFAFKTATLPVSTAIACLATFYDTTAGTQQFSIGYNSSGQIGLFQGGFPNGSGSLTPITGSSLSAGGAIIPNSYGFIEISATIGVSSPVVVKLNGTTVLNLSGVTTQSTANAWVNRLYLGSIINSGVSPSHSVDDWYILDTTGAAPLNTFLGNGRVQTDGPNADSATGGLNQWSFTTPQGTDWGNCANIPANTADYNFDGTVNDRMSLRFPAISATKVLFLNTWYSAEEDAAGVRTLVPIYRSNSVDQVGPLPVSLTGSYVYSNQPSTVDPNTTLSWASGTVAAAGACEIGLQVQS